MLSQILKMEGVTPLTKSQQGKVSGGQTCRITTSLYGVNIVSEAEFSEGSAGSSEANAYCVTIITNGNASSCSYDCFYDGFGQ